MNESGDLSRALLYPVCPFHPEGIVAESGDEGCC